MEKTNDGFEFKRVIRNSNNAMRNSNNATRDSSNDKDATARERAGQRHNASKDKKSASKGTKNIIVKGNRNKIEEETFEFRVVKTGEIPRSRKMEAAKPRENRKTEVARPRENRKGKKMKGKEKGAVRQGIPENGTRQQEVIENVVVSDSNESLELCTKRVKGNLSMKGKRRENANENGRAKGKPNEHFKENPNEHFKENPNERCKENPGESDSQENQIEIELPKKRKKTRMDEIHEDLRGRNVNEMIKKCVEYLRPGTKYGEEIKKYCESNYFGDMNYVTEIERVKNKTEKIEEEIKKWRKEKEDLEMRNKVLTERMGGDLKEDRSEAVTKETETSLKEDRKEILEEMQSKANELRRMRDKVKRYLEMALGKSEKMVKKVFSGMEGSGCNVMILLKAMSKLK